MDRLEPIHQTLAEALQRARTGDAFESPVTVAEIYQDLVPYRVVRTQLGFDMNADYEHTLLRLLAGESELARLEPPEARDELRAELSSANPNVGLFRKFAACDVWITRPRGGAPVAPEPAPAHATNAEPDAWESRAAIWMDPPDAPAPAAGEEAVAEEAFELLLEDAVEPETPAEEEAGETDSPVASSVPATSPTTPEETGLPTATTTHGHESAAPAAAHCAFCDSGLPQGRAVRFCPFCGADQSMLPCGACGEPLESDWRFCVACGATAGRS